MANTTYRRNNTERPSGSVSEQPYTVVGVGGKDRHVGNFSSNNPYLSQLKVANNNQDKDALYEYAVQWEADNANLQEQREYEDPINQIARQRAAGINPDISGSSSGGSSVSSGSTTPIADQQGQTKFSNYYDNLNNVYNGFNTAANVISSLTSAAGTAINGISTLKQLGPQLRIQEAAADVAENTVDAAITTSNNTAAKGSLDLVNERLLTIGRLSQHITKDTPDEDATSYLRSIGIPEDNVADTLSGVKLFNNSPKAQADYETAVRARNEQQAYNKNFTPRLLSSIYSATAEASQIRSDIELMRVKFEKALSEATIGNEQFQDNALQTATNASEAAVISSRGDISRSKLAANKAKHDNAAFIRYVSNLAAQVNQLEDERNSLNPFAPDYADKVRVLDYRLLSLYVMGSESVNQYVDCMRNYLVQQSMDDQYINYSVDKQGNPNLTYSDLLDMYAHSFRIGYSFDKFVSGGIDATRALQHSEFILDYLLNEQTVDISRNNLLLNQRLGAVDAIFKGLGLSSNYITPFSIGNGNKYSK